jgi:heme oxygenase
MSKAVAVEPETLTNRLRLGLAPLHAELEALMGLPGRLKTLADYVRCLRLFHGIFAPLEQSLGAQREWAYHGIDFESRRRAPALGADLRALGHEVPAFEPLNPSLFSRFSEAFGALYVLEGSTLGGKFILAAINQTIGPELSGATRFFSGHGAQSGALWRDFKAALDRYGRAGPGHADDVIAGAAECYGLFSAAAGQQSA